MQQGQPAASSGQPGGSSSQPAAKVSVFNVSKHTYAYLSCHYLLALADELPAVYNIVSF